MDIFLRTARLSDFELDKFFDLGAPQFERLLLSPPISAMLRTLHLNEYRLDMILDFKSEMMQYSQAFLGSSNRPIPYVCPTGGVMFDEDLTRIENRKVFGILCDFDFPLVWEHLDFSNELFEVIGQKSEQIDCLQKIEDALNLIRSTNKNAFDFIKTYTRIIHIRKSPEGSPSGSSSNLLRNGATILRGIELEEIKIHDVAEFILHEAIHHWLYIYEILESEFICERSGCRPINVAMESPWSGNRIAMDSFCHACFVWYGLYNFWNSVETNDTEVKLKKALSAEGFLKPVPLVSYLAINGLCMGGGLEECLKEMQNDVLMRENIF